MLGLTRPWKLTLKSGSIHLQRSHRVFIYPLITLYEASLAGKAIQDVITLQLHNEPSSISLRGLARGDGQRLLESLRIATAAALEPHKSCLLGWGLTLAHRLEINRWIGGREWSAICLERNNALPIKDGPSLDSVLSGPWPRQILLAQPGVRELSANWVSTLIESTPDVTPAHVVAHNERLLLEEPQRYSNFFTSVATSPLTEEQMAAAVCFEDRLLLVAAAGSGKTQTMIARAGYAVLSEQARPEELVMLAFNKDAATELEERVRTHLIPTVERADRITCTTFHSLALRIIGETTGRKPAVGRQLDNGQDIGVVDHILSQLINESASYSSMWSLYSIVLGQSAGEFEKAASDEDKPPLTISDPDAILTQRGEVVRSQEERIIADWLSLHGINYRYEVTYPHPTADQYHREYRPDFYYPDIDLYHEHFALDARGQPPASFEGYLDSVAWKRELHHQHQTALFETTSHGLRQGDDLERLKAELSARGLHPVADANNLANPKHPVEVSNFAKLARMFIVRYKSQALSINDLRASLDERPFPVRDQQFLNLFEPILERWNQRLADEGAVDYEDMLNQAAKHLENGEWQSPFRAIMVDEFQDTSPARAKIIRGLAGENVTLAAVGDDFQSIYRFAGADIRNMTQFEQRFGKARTLYLTKTFRSPQSLNELASAFVMRNPDQLVKSVVSANSAKGPRVHFRAYAPDAAQPSLNEQLDKLAAQARQQHLRVSVFLLGRYKHDRPDNLSALQRRHGGALDIRFLTVHASKGLEADYVFLLNMHNTELGFPMRRPEDELLGFVMPPDEAYEHAEERRLLYVAITRAKRQAVLVAEEGLVSDFVFELRDLGMGAVLDHRQLVEITPCPACDNGRLIPKINTRGEFISCNRHPHCAYKPPSSGLVTRNAQSIG